MAAETPLPLLGMPQEAGNDSSPLLKERYYLEVGRVPLGLEPILFSNFERTLHMKAKDLCKEKKVCLRSKRFKCHKK